MLILILRPLILSCVLLSLRCMPEYTARIKYVGDAQAVWLHLRLLRRRDAKSARQIQAFDVLPPSVEVIDHQLQHEVLGPVLLVIPLQDESPGSGAEDSYIIIEELLESEGFVKFSGQFEVPCRHEGTNKLRS